MIREGFFQGGSIKMKAAYCYFKCVVILEWPPKKRVDPTVNESPIRGYAWFVGGTLSWTLG
jgi:hypothetical protein